MHGHALHSSGRRHFVTSSTASDHDEPIFPNRSKDCGGGVPNQLWVADLTYIAILGGFVVSIRRRPPVRIWGFLSG